MNLRQSNPISPNSRPAGNGSVLVVVMMIALGLISMALYFANSMTLEMRASDNRTSAFASDQIIEGAARYVASILATCATNGAVPDISEYSAEAVAVGNEKVTEENGRFWLIGRDPTASAASEPYFALVDEASKLDLNVPWLTVDILSSNFPRMTYDLATAILDWRDTNGTDDSLNYSQLGYLSKHAPFETVGELRLVYGATREILLGEDLNQNGVLDANETQSGLTDPGLFDYVTVYSREPNTFSDGTMLTNVNDQASLRALLENQLGATRAQAIMQSLGFTQAGGGTPPSFASLLQFYISSRMSSDEFAQVYLYLTVTNAPYTVGRININTAPAPVLACLPGMDSGSIQQLISYRDGNPASLNSIAWIVDALGSSSAALATLAQSDCITVRSYQYTADIAAVGPFGRGYRRVRFVFDISDGTPKIIYRQDLTRLGWALGRQTRETWIAQATR